MSPSHHPLYDQALPDVQSRLLSRDFEAELYWNCASRYGHARPERFAPLLFRSLVQRHTFNGWCGRVNFVGSRGKKALLNNLRVIIRDTVDRRFPNLLSSDWKNIRDRINECLRSKRQIDVRTGPCY